MRDGDSATFGLPDPMMGPKGSVVEGTGTLSIAPAESLLLRLDLRFDQALGDYTPFDGDASQFTGTLGAVAAF